MKIHLMFHVSLLEPYYVSTIPNKTHEPLLPIVLDVEQEYKVENFLDSRISYHQLKYLVN